MVEDKMLSTNSGRGDIAQFWSLGDIVTELLLRNLWLYHNFQRWNILLLTHGNDASYHLISMCRLLKKIMCNMLYKFTCVCTYFMVVIVKAFVEVELIELRLLVQISLFPSPWGITFEAPKVSYYRKRRSKN